MSWVPGGFTGVLHNGRQECSKKEPNARTRYHSTTVFEKVKRRSKLEPRRPPLAPPSLPPFSTLRLLLCAVDGTREKHGLRGASHS